MDYGIDLRQTDPAAYRRMIDRERQRALALRAERQADRQAAGQARRDALAAAKREADALALIQGWRVAVDLKASRQARQTARTMMDRADALPLDSDARSACLSAAADALLSLGNGATAAATGDAWRQTLTAGTPTDLDAWASVPDTEADPQRRYDTDADAQRRALRRVRREMAATVSLATYGRAFEVDSTGRTSVLSGGPRHRQVTAAAVRQAYAVESRLRGLRPDALRSHDRMTAPARPDARTYAGPLVIRQADGTAHVGVSVQRVETDGTTAWAWVRLDGIVSEADALAGGAQMLADWGSGYRPDKSTTGADRWALRRRPMPDETADPLPPIRKPNPRKRKRDGALGGSATLTHR